MSQNISGINYVGETKPLYPIEAPGSEEIPDSAGQSSSIETSDENIYQDANFEDMSLEEVANAALDLEQEVLYLQAEMENLQVIIDSNKEIKQMYQQQKEELQKQLQQLQKDLSQAETPQEKETIKNRMTGLRGNINSLSNQIKTTLGIIRSHNEMKTDTAAQYASANSSLRQAQLTQSTKEAELNRSIKSAENASPISFSATGTSNSAAANGPSTGKASDNLINFLKDKEGCRLNAYQDSGGVWTIGYGHTGGVSAGQTISQEQAEQYLRQDLASFENAVTSAANSAGLELSQGQFDALVSFTYNCGEGNLKKSGIIGMLKSNNISGAQNKMKEYIHDSAGNRLQGLVTRRETEASWLAA